MYYDEQKLLIPNVIDVSNGYRLYSAKQIEDLNRIVLLRNMGFNVKEMGEILSGWNTAAMKADLEKQIKKTQLAIQSEQDRLKQIQGYLMDVENFDKNLNIQIIIKQIPAYHVVSLRKVVPNYYCEDTLWEEMGNYIKNFDNIKFSFSIYHDLDYRDQEVDIEICVVEKEEMNRQNSQLIYRQVEEVKMAASFMIYGSYSNIAIACKEFAYWLEQHKEYEMAGENRQICHVSMCHTENPEEYITELQIPLKHVNI